MSKRSRIITLSVLSILIVVCIVLGVTYSFMQANIDSTSVTEVSLSSCANIMLNDTDVSIDLENTYPMSRNRALQTAPYTFTVSSSCNESVGFYIYIATLNTNTLDANNIHYIITNHNSKEALVEGILGEAEDGLSDFEEYQINELNNGIKGTYGNIYRLYSNGLHNNSELTYDLYLYIDESVTNETMGLTFNAGIAVKTFDYNFPIVNSANTNEEKFGVVTLNINATPGDNEIVKYYFSKDGGETYVTSDNNSYTFTGLDAGKEYNFKVYVEDALGYTSAVYSLDETTSTLADLCGGLPLSYCITDVMYTGVDGDNNLYLHDGYGEYINSDLEARDNSYRFSGGNYKPTQLAKDQGYTRITSANLSENNDIINFYCNDEKSPVGSYCNWDYTSHYTLSYDPDNEYNYYEAALNQAIEDGYITDNNINNYVCLGRRCILDEDFLSESYRIIGAFAENGDYQVKLIKDAPYANASGRYSIDGSSAWSTAGPNAELNSTYLTELEDYFEFDTNLIVSHDWWVEGDTSENSYDYSVQGVYNVDSSSSETYNAKVALMYVSDYGYAASPDYWDMSVRFYYGLTYGNNWLIPTAASVVLGPISSQHVLLIDTRGNFMGELATVIGNYQPTFYLDSSVRVADGNGTKEDPFIIFY